MTRGSAPTNPFQYGALALDQAFTDREGEIAELSADVRNGQDVVVFAPRRYGKSSLSWRVVQRLGQPGVLVGQADLRNPPTAAKGAGPLSCSTSSRKSWRSIPGCQSSCARPSRSNRRSPTCTWAASAT